MSQILPPPSQPQALSEPGPQAQAPSQPGLKVLALPQHGAQTAPPPPGAQVQALPQPGAQTAPPPPGRAEIVDWLAGLGERPAGNERIDSMELAWLVHQVEQRYAVELTDDHLDQIHTIDDAVAVLGEVLTTRV